MNSGPSKFAEAVVALIVPPACREEVMGDLHERFHSPFGYAADVARTVPVIICSRMRRTADPQIVVIQSFAVYMSFFGSAWLQDRLIVRAPWGLLRLAIPAAMIMIGILLDSIYAHPGRRSVLKLAQGPLLGLFLALVSQGTLWIGRTGLSIPRGIALAGCVMSLVFTSALRTAFPPASDGTCPPAR